LNIGAEIIRGPPHGILNSATRSSERDILSPAPSKGEKRRKNTLTFFKNIVFFTQTSQSILIPLTISPYIISSKQLSRRITIKLSRIVLISIMAVSLLGGSLFALNSDMLGRDVVTGGARKTLTGTLTTEDNLEWSLKTNVGTYVIHFEP